MPYYYDLPELRPVAPELEVPELIIPSDYINNKRPLSPTSSCAKFDCSPVKRSRGNLATRQGNGANCYNATVDLDQVYNMSHYPSTHQGAYPDMSIYQPEGSSCPWRQELDQTTLPQAPWRQDTVPTPTTTALSKVAKKVSSFFKKPSAKKSAKTTQQRRKRTVFTAEELAILNGYYEVNKFLNPGLKAEILEKIDVPGNVLVMWYQNKRAKDRASGMII